MGRLPSRTGDQFPSACDDNINLQANEFNRKLRETVSISRRRSTFKVNILAFDVTKFTQALAKCFERA